MYFYIPNSLWCPKVHTCMCTSMWFRHHTEIHCVVCQQLLPILFAIHNSICFLLKGTHPLLVCTLYLHMYMCKFVYIFVFTIPTQWTEKRLFTFKSLNKHLVHFYPRKSSLSTVPHSVQASNIVVYIC